MFVVPDMAVDGLVSDPQEPEPAEPPRDLLRTEVLAQPSLNDLPIGRRESLVPSRPGSPPTREVIGELGTIGSVLLDVTAHLAANGAAVPAEGAGDLRLAAALFAKRRERIPLL